MNHGISSQYQLPSKVVLKRNQNTGNLSASEGRQKYIKKRIRQVCDFFGANLHMKAADYRSQFMVDAEHKLAYCRHGKVIFKGHFSKCHSIDTFVLTGGNDDVDETFYKIVTK